MPRRDLNPVKKWLEEEETALHHGMVFTLADLLSRDDIEEADVAAALFFHAWDSPQAFWNAVLEERRVRMTEERFRSKIIETFSADDLIDLLKCARALADGSSVEILVSWRDKEGVLHETAAELNDLLKKKEDACRPQPTSASEEETAR